MFDKDFWGEIISTYTDADAQEDGILIDVSDLGVEFNGKIVNRATTGAAKAAGLKENQFEAAKNNMEFIARNSSFDGAGADAWGIFTKSERFGGEKLWLVPNEVMGYTLMLPSEY